MVHAKLGLCLSAAVVSGVGFTAAPAHARNPDGTLGLARRPASTQPVIRLAGQTFPIDADAPPDATDWQVELLVPNTEIGPRTLAIEQAEYESQRQRWRLVVRIPDDIPEELYDLRLSHAGGTDTNRIAVTVLREWPADYSFAHFSDTQNLFAVPGITGNMQALVDDISFLQPAFALNTGDLVTYGDENEYRDYIAILESARVPVFHIPGNHDIFWVRCLEKDVYRERYERFIGELNYSFEFGEHVFIGVDLSGYEALCPGATLGEVEREHLERELIDHVNAPLKVVFAHQPEYTGNALRDVAMNHGVHFFLHGHFHRDVVELVGDTTFAGVGWAGDVLYRMLRVESDTVLSYTYAGDDISSIPGGDVFGLQSMATDGDETDVTVTLSSALDDAFPGLALRVELPTLEQGWQYAATGGTLWQLVTTDFITYAYVRDIELAPNGDTPVRVYARADEPPPDGPDGGPGGDGDGGGTDNPMDPGGDPGTDEPDTGGCELAGTRSAPASGWSLLAAALCCYFLRRRRSTCNNG